jgi:hypothetical protein
MLSRRRDKAFKIGLHPSDCGVGQDRFFNQDVFDVVCKSPSELLIAPLLL